MISYLYVLYHVNYFEYPVYGIYNTGFIEIYNGTIRGGETKIFENSGLILGDVNPNALVIAKDELFIVGKLKGKVIIRNKEGKVDASSYHNAYIKIFDKINTNFSYDNPLFINYLNLNETPKRGTKVWQE